MSTNYPAQIDTTQSLPTVVDNFTPVKGIIVNQLRDAIIAVESALGTSPNGNYGTVGARIANLENTVGNLQIIEIDQDLGGTLEEPLVIGIQGRPVSSVTPSQNEVLMWNGIAWVPGNVGSGNFLAGGDLGGNNISQTVVGLQGHPISNAAPGVNNVLVWNGTSWAPASSTLAGDVTGSSSANTVSKIQGVTISGTPSTGYVLEATSPTAASWQAADAAQQTFYGAYASRPAAAVAGRVYVPSDGPVSYVDTGSTWLPVIPGVVTNSTNGVNEVCPGNVNPLTAYAINSCTTATAVGGTLSIQTTSTPQSSNSFQLFDMAYTPGQVFTAWFDATVFVNGRAGIYIANSHVLPSTSFNMLGWSFYKTGSPGQFEIDNIYYNGSWTMGSFSPNPSQTGLITPPTPIGLRISLSSGTTYNFEWSNGVTWTTLLTTDVSAYVGTPSHCGFFIDNAGTTNYIAAKILGWTVM